MSLPPPRVVTGGRPATMTRSAVQHARTHARPTTPTAPIAIPIPGGSPDSSSGEGGGWVSVDNHRRKKGGSGNSTNTSASMSSSPVVAPVAAAASTANARRNANGNSTSSNATATNNSSAATARELRRTQSAQDAAATKEKEKDEKEPPVARPNARADALSAAVTMDKKARERSYYNGNAASQNQASSPPASAVLAATAVVWGSPPQTTAMGMATLPPPRHPNLGRSKSSSPDAAAALERASSLQKLMESWQTVEGVKEQPGHHRNATRASRASGKTDNSSSSNANIGDPPASMPLRRAQSDATSQSTTQSNGSRVRSPTGNSNNSSGRNLTCIIDEATGDTNILVHSTTSGATPSGGNEKAKKCGDKRDFFFRNLDFETRSMLQIDDVAAYSVTDFEMARKISHAIVELFPACKNDLEGSDRYGDDGETQLYVAQRKFPLVITDATACVGGNVLSFCDFFKHVYAVEYDRTRVSMLENNLRVLHKSNVTCRCASYLDVMYEYDQDVVFVDPPWGGPEYKEQDKVDLFLGDKPLYEICERLKGHAQCVVLKVPTNFDDEKFARHVSGKVTVRKDFKKMHLIVLDFRPSRGSPVR